MTTAASERRARAKSRVDRDATIHIRAPKRTKELIETAAQATGKTLSEFTLDSARQSAIDVLLDQRLFVLESDRYAAFLRALDNPPAAGPKLKALMKKPPLWQR
jgi:uncharacterized protein (DUF1778 family)